MAEYEKENPPDSNEQQDEDKPKKKKLDLQFAYQAWYSKSLPVIRQLLPERYREFQDQYKLEKRKDNDIDFLTYTISDYLIGLTITRGYDNKEVVNRFAAFSSKFQHQLAIFQSATGRIDSLLADIEGVLQSGMFRHELEVADDLLSKNHVRAAGALAGVSLETHLGRVCSNHKLSLNKKSPTISDLNEALKTANILDVPTWRLIQRLGDIRNFCVHRKEREPTADEVNDLLSGTRKILASVY